MSPADLVRERQQVLEKNRAAAKAYRKRKRDKEMILRDRVDQLEREAKMYRQCLIRHGIPDPVIVEGESRVQIDL